MTDVALPCLRSRLGIALCLNSATLQREQHGGRRDESGAAQGRRSIPSRQLVAGTQTDPRIQSELKDDVRDRRLGCLVLRVEIVISCPPLRSQRPCRNPGVLSLALFATMYTPTVP